MKREIVGSEDFQVLLVNEGYKGHLVHLVPQELPDLGVAVGQMAIPDHLVILVTSDCL